MFNDVDLNHPNFRASFPDGKVPIRTVPGRFHREFSHSASGETCVADGMDLLDHLERQCAVKDAIADYDLELLTACADQLWSYELIGGKREIEQTTADAQERRALVGEMMQGGLTLRQIARFSGRTETDVAAFVTRYAPTRERTLALLDADELLHDRPELSNREIERRTTIDKRTVRDLRSLRCCADAVTSASVLKHDEERMAA